MSAYYLEKEQPPMNLMNLLKKTAGDLLKDASNKAVKAATTKTETFTFSALPTNTQELKALPEASLDSPFKTAALTVCALCQYAVDPASGTEMLNFLKGPQPLVPREIQFLHDRFMDGKNYVPRSFFKGAVPSNDYTPSTPYTISVFTNPYSYDQEGYAKLWIRSGGADTERQVTLRKKGEQWFLWDQLLLADIRKPTSQDPWA